MKVCVLGNSQAACLKNAWDVAENRPAQHDVTFFAAFDLSLSNLKVEGGRLVPATEGLRRNLLYTSGLSDVDVAAYDVFLICGAGLAFRPVDARTSRQVVATWTADLLKTSLAYELAKKVRQLTDKPIYIMPAPLFDERTAVRARFDVLEYSSYIPLLEQALDIPNTVLLRQPDETITRGHYTKLDFSKDAVRLAVSDAGEGVRHKEDDYNHMNTAYGAVRLKDFFEKLDRV